MPYKDIGGLFNWKDCGVMRGVNVSTQETTVEKRLVIARAIVTKKSVVHVWTRDLHDF